MIFNKYNSWPRRRRSSKRFNLINKLDEANRRKRRSKNDQEGRGFMCECGKSYLSQPALTNHKKTKHDQNNSGLKRGRGRPRKNVLILIRFKYSHWYYQAATKVLNKDLNTFTIKIKEGKRNLTKITKLQILLSQYLMIFILILKINAFQILKNQMTIHYCT
jgi:hypothetical protein